MAGHTERGMDSGQFFVCGKILPRGHQSSSAEAYFAAEAGDLRGRRIGSGQATDRGEVRRIRDARRFAGKDTSEDCRSQPAAGTAEPAAAAVRGGGAPRPGRKPKPRRGKSGAPHPTGNKARPGPHVTTK